MNTANDRITHEPIDDIPIKKRPYTPPVLSILETHDIAGGTTNLQEADGGGFVS